VGKPIVDDATVMPLSWAQLMGAWTDELSSLSSSLLPQAASPMLAHTATAKGRAKEWCLVGFIVSLQLLVIYL
jgi:hypothetical protein